MTHTALAYSLYHRLSLASHPTCWSKETPFSLPVATGARHMSGDDCPRHLILFSKGRQTTTPTPAHIHPELLSFPASPLNIARHRRDADTISVRSHRNASPVRVPVSTATPTRPSSAPIGLRPERPVHPLELQPGQDFLDAKTRQHEPEAGHPFRYLIILSFARPRSNHVHQDCLILRLTNPTPPAIPPFHLAPHPGLCLLRCFKRPCPRSCLKPPTTWTSVACHGSRPPELPLPCMSSASASCSTRWRCFAASSVQPLSAASRAHGWRRRCSSLYTSSYPFCL